MTLTFPERVDRAQAALLGFGMRLIPLANGECRYCVASAEASTDMGRVFPHLDEVEQFIERSKAEAIEP